MQERQVSCRFEHAMIRLFFARKKCAARRGVICGVRLNNDGVRRALALPLSSAGRQNPMERRDIKRRAAIVQRVINDVVQNPSITLTIGTLQQWLRVPEDAARRILDRLISSGLVREVQRDVWARGPMGAGPQWY